MVVRKGCVFVVERSSVVEFQVCPHTCAPTCILDHVAVLRGREGKQYVSETAVNSLFVEFFFYSCVQDYHKNGLAEFGLLDPRVDYLF